MNQCVACFLLVSVPAVGTCQVGDLPAVWSMRMKHGSELEFCACSASMCMAA